jgi:hypothetical protein
MAADNQGIFPTVRTLHAISGKHHITAPGSEMPGWESILGADQGKEALARLRVYNLVQYLKGIQVAELPEER